MNSISTADSAEGLRHAAEVHDRILTLDGHVDVLLDVSSKELALGKAQDRSQFDLVRARKGHLSGAVLTVHAGPAKTTAEGMAAGRRELEDRYQLISDLGRQFPTQAAIADTPSQFRSISSSGKFAIIMGLQNAGPLGHDLDQIDAWASRGIRVFAFTFIGNNQWADSARPYPFIQASSARGLTPLGRQAVGRLNDLGIIVDVSQLSSQAFAEVIDHSSAPVLASHSGVRGLVDIDRNFSDSELSVIAANGGVINLVAFGPYLRRPTKQMLDEVTALWRRHGLVVTGALSDLLSVNDPATANWDDDRFWEFLHEFHVILDLEHPAATVRDLVDAIDYTVERIGIDHVGVASDFNHSGGVVDWHHVGQSTNVTAELLRRGYPEADIAKIWGENFLRVWNDVLRRGNGDSDKAGLAEQKSLGS